MSTASTQRTFHVPPAQQKNLRACMVCSIVQLQSRFVADGCPNCEEYLDMASAPDAVEECTSPVYEGLITLTDPTRSWVARWSRLDGYVRGTYAVKVVGTLPDEYVQRLEDKGVRYIPRDGSAGDDD
ncbi:MAG: transcription elongation factor spt4 [Peltula sp. TS41687]|nr:MAG: transcription elongation factor spt4 [Peltula sp. TS41687]